jgi:hypothetical protein
MKPTIQQSSGKDLSGRLVNLSPLICLTVRCLAALTALMVLASVGAMGAAKYYVSFQAMPTSLSYVVTDENVTLSRSSVVHSVAFRNTDTGSHTVTMQDCQGTPFKLFDGANTASTIAAGEILSLNFGDGIKFKSCVKWQTSDAKVFGALSVD